MSQVCNIVGNKGFMYDPLDQVLVDNLLQTSKLVLALCNLKLDVRQTITW